MKVLAIICLSFILAEGALISLAPEAVKKMIEELPPSFLRAAGFVELLLAAAGFLYLNSLR